MSVTTIRSIHCDGCGDWEYENIGESIASVRKRLRHVGWQVGVPGDEIKLDYCPKCRERRS